jgi:predicted methyltransferase
MKTDYFSTFLDTVNNRPTKSVAPQSATASPASAPTDPSAILKALAGQKTVSLADLVTATDSSPTILIPALQQLRDFGLVDYDSTGVRLTQQGNDVTSSPSFR